MKTAIIDPGGGLRGIYAVGIMDYLMDQKITFDLGIGISAGSANMASYMSNQRGRNYIFYTQYAFRKKYMSFTNYILHRNFINLDYVYSTLSNSNGENPYDYQTLKNNPMEMIVIATNALTGEAKYFTKEDIEQDNYDVMKASSCLPFICQPYFIDGIPYYDGALSDCIPIQKALDLGCDRIVLILSRPKNEIKTVGLDGILASKIAKKYPKAAEKFTKRSDVYNEAIALAKKLEKKGKVIIIAPSSTMKVKTLKKKRKNLIKLYQLGYQDGEKIKHFLENSMN